jgi:hypothetical protein
MAEAMRQWRPHPLMRAGGVFIAAVGLFAAGMVVYASFFVGNPADRLSTGAAVFGVPVFLALAAIGLSYTVRYRIVLTDDTLTVVNFVKEQFPIGHVASARPSRNGIVFTMYGGKCCVASAVETGLLAQSLGRRTRADEVIDAVMKAAGRGHT